MCKRAFMLSVLFCFSASCVCAEDPASGQGSDSPNVFYKWFLKWGLIVEDDTTDEPVRPQYKPWLTDIPTLKMSPDGTLTTDLIPFLIPTELELGMKLVSEDVKEMSQRLLFLEEEWIASDCKSGHIMIDFILAKQTLGKIANLALSLPPGENKEMNDSIALLQMIITEIESEMMYVMMKSYSPEE